MQGRIFNRAPNISTEAVEFKLLRFFDFSVKPGKSYIYRVSLALKNPNFGIDTAKLQNADYAKEKYFFTNLPTNDKLPTQTNRVDVPKDTQILVGAAKSEEPGPGKFPVILLTWVQKNGRAGYFSLTNVDHGQVLNVMNEKVTPVPVEPSATAPTDTEDIKADFITDTTLLDRDGGKKFIASRKPTVPREMLFMAVNGKSITLMLREELEDMSEINRITTKPETTSSPGGRGPAIHGTDPRTLIRGAGGGGGG
jgi:hypothetical protein